MELAPGCPTAGNEREFCRAMVDAGARWSVFHVIRRVPDAVRRDRPRGDATLRQQVLAWLAAFTEMSDEWGRFSALGRQADQVRARLKTLWSAETHDVPYYPAFRDS